MFVDESSILVIGGRGGNGCLSFRREKFVPRGGPDGGDGGDGGAVVFRADENESSLLRFRYHSQFTGERGRHGEGSNRTGRSGPDLEVPVPVGTVVWDEDRTRVLADLDAPGATFVAARGGRGGRGNARFKSSVRQAPTRHEPGEEGERRVLRLELKLMADVGLLGFPNAGKSTLIRRISAARPKVADYPFTTLAPHLGVVARDEHRSFVVADIPGLIEGAHEGAGLGLQFLRHVERCRVLLHLVDVAEPDADPVERVETLARELSGYSSELAAKRRMIVATKLDAAQDPAPRARLEAWAAREGFPFHAISSATGEGVRELVARTGTMLDG